MSQIGRALKNLEAPRPLKSSISRLSNAHHAPAYELQTSKFIRSLNGILIRGLIEFLFSVLPVEELITLIENVADSVSMGQCNPDSMGMLLANLRIHGPQLEDYSKSTLDQGKSHNSRIPPWNILTHIPASIAAYVKFRNASQDERLSIITRMNLLELIELRAKSWQISDGLNTYYKHKASDVQVRDAPNCFQPRIKY